MLGIEVKKPKTDVLFEFMEVMIGVSSAGIVVDAHMANKYGWSKSQLAEVLNVLAAKGIVICTEDRCRHRRVALPQHIKSHMDWLVLYYRGDVPNRYLHHLVQ